MKQTVITGVLAVTTIVFGGLYLSSRNNQAETLQSVVAVSQPGDVASISAQPSDDMALQQMLKGKDERINVLRLQLEKTETQLGGNESRIAGLLEEIKNAEKANQDLAVALKMASQTNMMQTSAKELEEIRGYVSERYADFFDNSGLSGDDRTAFFALLVEEQDSNSVMMPEDVNEKVKELFGEDVLNKYTDYKKFLQLRDFVGDFEGYLSQQNYSLSRPQKDFLLAMDTSLFDEQSNGALIVNLGDGTDIHEAMNKNVEKTAQIYDAILDRAKETLDSDQLTALDSYLGDQFARKEGQAKMAEQFMKNMPFGSFGSGVSSNGFSSFKMYSSPPSS